MSNIKNNAPEFIHVHDVLKAVEDQFEKSMLPRIEVKLADSRDIERDTYKKLIQELLAPMIDRLARVESRLNENIKENQDNIIKNQQDILNNKLILQAKADRKDLESKVPYKWFYTILIGGCIWLSSLSGALYSLSNNVSGISKDIEFLRIE